MRDRIATIGPIAAVAGVLGICCGLPVLLSIGVVGAIAGWSLQSWVLIGLGLVVAAVGWVRWARSRRSDHTRHDPLPATHENAASDQTADSTPDVTTNGNNR
jgi:uncharacterized membrane protein YidH (DUF202 family)